MSDFRVPSRNGDEPEHRALGNRETGRTEISIDLGHARSHLRTLDEEINRMQRQIRLQIQERLQVLAGCTLNDTRANQELVREIQAMLERNGLRVRCPECGHPAILRVSPRSGAKHGVFVFDHTIDGRRTFHGGRGTLPVLRLVVKPPRATKRGRRSEKAG